MQNPAQLLKHLVILAAIALVVTVVYSKVTGAYFCSYDDFLEVHRSAFEDAREPLRIFTTPHFGSFSYRPLNRGVNFVTYWINNGDPLYYRIRNVISHILNVTLVFAIGWLLFKSLMISSTAALLFGIHPLANQSVIGAVMTNTMAHTFFLLSLVMFIISFQSRHFWIFSLIASFISAWIAILFYDPEMMVYLMMSIYYVLFVMIYQEHRIRWTFTIVFILGLMISFSSYYLLRAVFVPHGAEQAALRIPPIGLMAKSLSMYVAALLLPVDVVLANEWLRTPLPPELTLNVFTVMATGILAVGGMLALVLVIRRWTSVKNLVMQRREWPRTVFLMCGMIVPLIPVLALRSRPSETYIYLSVAFYTLLLSYVLTRLLWDTQTPRGQTAYAAVVIVLLGLFCTATWVRNDRVVRCGDTAYRILSGLHDQALTEGRWTLSFANVPGEPASRRYGFYGYHGIDTIGSMTAANKGLTAALQWVYANESLNGEIVSAEELTALCRANAAPHHRCFWVHWDGRVEEFPRRAQPPGSTS